MYRVVKVHQNERAIGIALQRVNDTTKEIEHTEPIQPYTKSNYSLLKDAADAYNGVKPKINYHQMYP